MYFLFDSVFLEEVKRDGMIDRFRVTVRYTLQWDAALSGVLIRCCNIHFLLLADFPENRVQLSVSLSCVNMASPSSADRQELGFLLCSCFVDSSFYFYEICRVDTL